MPAVTSGRRTCLIHHIDEGLRVVPKEATDRVTLILTREYHIDQGGEFTQSERASGQTPTGWNIEVWKAGAVSTPRGTREGGAEGAPLSDVEVVAA